LDRRPPEQDLTRVNERINVPEVRLIDEQGQQIGVLKVADALKIAQERDLDLVEVAPQARPPVARVLDYSKYKYEQALKQKQARKHQQQITVREIKFRPKIAQHDYDTKRGHVKRFLLGKAKVKITIMFRGREVAHPERGVAILDRLAEELADLAVVEQSPTLDGRNMAMLLAPSKAVLVGNAELGKLADGIALDDPDALADALEDGPEPPADAVAETAVAAAPAPDTELDTDAVAEPPPAPAAGAAASNGAKAQTSDAEPQAVAVGADVPNLGHAAAADGMTAADGDAGAGSDAADAAAEAPQAAAKAPAKAAAKAPAKARAPRAKKAADSDGAPSEQTAAAAAAPPNAKPAKPKSPKAAAPTGAA
jgi:translation initiation factor IF-3